MISAEAQAERERLRAGSDKPDVPLAQRRREWEAEARLAVLPREARFSATSVDDVLCEWMEMPRVWRDRVLLYLHGGSFNSGSPRTHRRLSADLSRALLMRVLVPDYRLAPEHPFPTAVRDALVAYGWLLKQGITEDNIIIGGDSAGGGLALSMLLALRDAKAKMPRGAILLSPWADLTCAGGSYTQLKKLDPVMRREGMLEAAQLYAGKRNPAGPLLSPVNADLSGLPPMLVHVGGDEILLDDSRRLVERAKAAGVDASLKVFEGMWHAFHFAGMGVPEARQAIDEVGAFGRGLFRPAALSPAPTVTVPIAAVAQQEPEKVTGQE